MCRKESRINQLGRVDIMKEQEEQGCLKPMVIGIIIAAIFILMAFLFVPHHKPETYNPLEDVIRVEEPVLKIDNQGRYYISTKRSYYRIKSEKEGKELIESVEKKRNDLEKQVQQQNININHNIHITIEDESW